jgi:hypothetical protein
MGKDSFNRICFKGVGYVGLVQKGRREVKSSKRVRKARSRMKASPSDAIIEFVETVNRLGYTAEEIADELVSLQRSGADWPEQTRKQWLNVIAFEVANGRLVSGLAGVITLPVPERIETVKQLSLFE